MSEIDLDVLNGFILSEKEDYFEISAGTVYPKNAFVPDSTYRVAKDSPEKLWKAFHAMLGINTPEIPETPKPVKKAKDSLELELLSMTSKAIIDRVLKETGIFININPKSKKSIVRKAVKLITSKS